MYHSFNIYLWEGANIIYYELEKEISYIMCGREMSTFLHNTHFTPNDSLVGEGVGLENLLVI